MHVRFLRVLILAMLIAMPAAAQMNNVKTVFVIVMENHNWSQFKGAANAPYMNNTLLPHASHAEQYYNPPALHPSLPNYIWIEAGSNLGITNDNDPATNHQSTTSHLVTQLKNAGISWKTYQEDIPGTACPLTSVNLYRPKHNPFVYFDDVTDTNNPNSAYCIAHVRPYTELATDLQNNTVAQYVFITPNVCDDGHDSCAPVSDPIRQTDNWLAANVPAILNSTAYQTGGAIFITWDEGMGSSDGPIGMIVLSPFAKGAGYSNSIHYTHGSLLRTVEEIFGVGLLRDAAVQTNLSDLFANPNPPAPPASLSGVPGNSSVALSWAASSGASSYNVKRSLTSGGPYGTVTSVTTTNFTDTNLTNGTTYYYVVTAVNASGESGNSPQASATPNVAPPPAPTNLTATAGDTRVTLNWTAAPGATSYQVSRGTTNGGPYGILASGITATSFPDNTVSNGTTYYYVVVAVNSGGFSPNSNQASATPTAAPSAIVRINAGGLAISPFTADTGFSGGQVASTTATIDVSNDSFPAPLGVYQSWRTGIKKAANFSYTLTGFNANAAYTLRLHFAENSVSKSGARKFDVTVNGVKVLAAFDVFAAAGGKNKAVIKDFRVNANSNGQIVVSFTAVTAAQDPIINGIEVDN